MPERYRGRPLLILIENYILDAIGELQPEKVDGVAAAIRRVWGGGPDWRATFRTALDVDESIDDELRRLWVRNREIAQGRAEVLTPEDFARMIADENFAANLTPTD